MERLNDKRLSYYGLIPIGYHGILDMPSRLGNTFYDWGDHQQPLVEEEDIFWRARDFGLTVVFDERRTSRTLTWAVNEMATLPECLLQSKYGNFNVKVKAVQKVSSYKDITRLSLLFNERTPRFNGILASPIGGNGPMVDGHGFKKDFGIVIRKVRSLDHAPVSKQLSSTVFNTSPILSDHRAFKVFELDCAKAFTDVDELRETMDRFKKLLSQGGYRTITYRGENHSCFLTEGFRVVFVGDSLIKFKLRLNIRADMVNG